MKQVQYDQDDGDNEQRMDPTAGLWDPVTYVSAEKPEQPQDDQNDDDGPQHEISPFPCQSSWTNAAPIYAGAQGSSQRRFFVTLK